MNWIFGITGTILLIYLISTMTMGDGAWERATTFSGVVSIETYNKKVVCFQDANGSGGISCLPKRWIEEGKNEPTK